MNDAPKMISCAMFTETLNQIETESVGESDISSVIHNEAERHNKTGQMDQTSRSTTFLSDCLCVYLSVSMCVYLPICVCVKQAELWHNFTLVLSSVLCADLLHPCYMIICCCCFLKL